MYMKSYSIFELVVLLYIKVKQDKGNRRYKEDEASEQNGRKIYGKEEIGTGENTRIDRGKKNSLAP